jgi:hypothetical protein
LLRTSLSEAVVVPPLPAQILRLVVRPGDTVAKDAPIAEVVMPELDAALAQVNGATSALDVLTRRRAQLLSLQGEGLVRGADLSSLELELARQTTDKLRAQAVVSAARSTSGGRVLLRSPLAGVVIDVPAVVGELRRPEDGPLARIQSRTGQRIEATFQAKPLAEAGFAFRSESGSVPLTLLNWLPAANGLGYLAWFETPAGTEMPTAALGRVVVERAATPDALLVPSSAVGTQGEAHFVVVRSKGSASPVAIAVEVLRAAKTEALIRGALPEGALVATDPGRALPPKASGAPR